MALGTIIYSGLAQHGKNVRALVLMGAGAQTAYQSGVLKAMAAMLALSRPPNQPWFPFKVLVGTSAGALNAAYLAGCAQTGWESFAHLAAFWEPLRSGDVYQLTKTSAGEWFGGSHKYLAVLNLSRGALAHGAILDNAPLIETLLKAIWFPGIDGAPASKVLTSVAVTASSYSSGVHWTFCSLMTTLHPTRGIGPDAALSFRVCRLIT